MLSRAFPPAHPAPSISIDEGMGNSLSTTSTRLPPGSNGNLNSNLNLLAEVGNDVQYEKR